MPNFLLLGGGRCGTTWVHNCLKEHPMVFVPDIKELHFFSVNFNKGIDYYDTFFTDAEKGDYKAIGECSPTYLHDERCPRRIAHHLPAAKLIAILRNPVERAYSHYLMFKRNHYETIFEEALKAQPILLNAGLYYEQLMRYYKYFDKKQILVLLFDDLKLEPLEFIQRIYRFLGVDPEFTPSLLDKASNIVIYPRLQDVLYKLRVGWIIELVKKTPLDPFLRNIANKKRWKSYPKMALTTKEKLQEYYKTPNEQLSQLIERDLDMWL